MLSRHKGYLSCFNNNLVKGLRYRGYGQLKMNSYLEFQVVGYNKLIFFKSNSVTEYGIHGIHHIQIHLLENVEYQICIK